MHRFSSGILLFQILLDLVLGSAVGAQLLTASAPIQRPRFASGNVVTPRGQNVLAGGRIGPFVSVTEPLTSHRARVDLYTVKGDMLLRLGSSPNLRVVEDVAAADLDGDGLDEVITVGAGRIIMMRWTDGRLEPFETFQLDSERTPRIAAVENGSKVQLAVVEYEAPEQGDVGRSRVSLIVARNGSLERIQQITLEAHVGDLVFAYLIQGSSEPELLLETGTGEEGGELTLFQMSADHWHRAWNGKAHETGSLRLLGLHAAPGGLVAARSVDGKISIHRWDGTSLRVAGLPVRAHPSSGMLLLGRQDGSIDILTVAADPSVFHLTPLPF